MEADGHLAVVACAKSEAGTLKAVLSSDPRRSTVHEMTLYGAWLLLRIVHGEVRSQACVDKIVSLLKKSLPLTFTTNVIRYTLEMYELRSESSRMVTTVKVRAWAAAVRLAALRTPRVFASLFAVSGESAAQRE